MNRGGMVVTAQEIRAWLKSGESDSSFDHAFADGAVKIVQNTPVRNRSGRSDHAEYYTEDGKVILTGGRPEFTDSVKGSTKGDKITYFTTTTGCSSKASRRSPLRAIFCAVLLTHGTLN